MTGGARGAVLIAIAVLGLRPAALAQDEAPAVEALAAALAAAKTDEERDALLETEPALVTLELRKALIEQGNTRRQQGEHAQALALYEWTRRLAERMGDRAGVASALSGIAGVAYYRADYATALEHYRQSLALAEAAGDRSIAAGALRTIGSIHYLQGDYLEALEYYEKAVALREALDDRRGLARLQVDIGSLHFRWGDLDRALDHYQRGLTMAEALDDTSTRTMALNSIGLVQSVRGDYDLALETHRKVLRLVEEAGGKDRHTIAYALDRMGVIYFHQGSYARALEQYSKSLALEEALGDTRGVAGTLLNVGAVHFMLGSHDLALEHFQKSLAMKEAIGDRRDAANALIGLGVIFRDQGDYAQALERFQKGLKLAEELGDKALIAYAQNQTGVAHHMQGSYGQALDHYRKSLALKEGLGEKRGIAEALKDIARVQCDQGDHGPALDTAERAVAVAAAIGLRETLWEAHTTAGKALRGLGRPVEARHAFDQAIATIEDLRAEVGGSEQARQRFFENKVSPYHAAVQILHAQGDDRAALAYAERAKSRVLLDVLQESGIRVTKAMTVPEQGEERRLKAALVSLNTQVTRESQRPRPDEARLDGLRSGLKTARLGYEAFQAALYAAHPSLRTQRGEARPVTLEEAAELVPDATTAVLEYVVTDDETYLFVLTKAREAAVVLRSHVLRVKRRDLAREVAAFRGQLAVRDQGFRPRASRLYDLLLMPARAELQGRQTVVIVPDGTLWELPFQALLDERGRYLVEGHAISYAPSLTVLREMAKMRNQEKGGGPGSRTLLAMGNPDLGKTAADRLRLVHRDERLDPLPEAEREVKTLGRIYGPAHSRVYVGAAAREDRMKAEGGRFGTLHLATHAILDDASPMYSQVVLAQAQGGAAEDGLLEAWEIMDLDLNADLVVLSACETGRGRVGDGEGVIGLTWALFVAGCPTTVVSQWKVASASTTRLMLDFHQNLRPRIKGSRPSAARALQKAAVAMLRGTDRRHPFYWAGFVVVGSAK